MSGINMILNCGFVFSTTRNNIDGIGAIHALLS